MKWAVVALQWCLRLKLGHKSIHVIKYHQYCGSYSLPYNTTLTHTHTIRLSLTHTHSVTEREADVTDNTIIVSKGCNLKGGSARRHGNRVHISSWRS